MKYYHSIWKMTKLSLIEVICLCPRVGEGGNEIRIPLSVPHHRASARRK